MKKVMMMLALLALPFALQAQSKFHDVEANDAQGPVKKIVQNIMGQEIVVNFSPEGKMESSTVTDAVYDANGYIQSAKQSMQGQTINVNYKWKDGRLVCQSLGEQASSTLTYNDKGAVCVQTISFGGQEMKMEFKDFVYDSHGNWISRKTTMMGQEMELTRTIEYYE